MKKEVMFFVVLFLLSIMTVSYAQEKEATEGSKAVKKTERQLPKEDAKLEEQLMPHRDIKDVPVPYQMKLDKDNTYILDVKGMKLGLLTYVGRVDGYSLAENLKATLAEEKWKLQSMQNYKKTVSLSFTKEDRICNVFIEEGFFNTRLEIRISAVNSN